MWITRATLWFQILITRGQSPYIIVLLENRDLKAAISASIRILMNEHNFPLPQSWTYEQLADEIIGQPVDLGHLLAILKELTTFGFASQPFHQLLDFLH